MPRERVVGATGFEPVTTRTPSVCATRLRYAPTVAFGIGLFNTTGILRQLRRLRPYSETAVFRERIFYNHPDLAGPL